MEAWDPPEHDPNSSVFPELCARAYISALIPAAPQPGTKRFQTFPLPDVIEYKLPKNKTLFIVSSLYKQNKFGNKKQGRIRTPLPLILEARSLVCCRFNFWLITPVLRPAGISLSSESHCSLTRGTSLGRISMLGTGQSAQGTQGNHNHHFHVLTPPPTPKITEVLPNLL